MDNNNPLFSGPSPVITPSYASGVAENLSTQAAKPEVAPSIPPNSAETPQNQPSTPYKLDDLESPGTTPLASGPTAAGTASPVAAGPVSQDYATPSPVAPTPGSSVPAPKNRGLIKKLLTLLAILGAVGIVIAVAITMVLQNRKTSQQAASETIPDQTVELGASAGSEAFDLAIKGQNDKLIVNGSVVSRSDVVLTTKSGNDYGQISAENLTSTYTYLLPNANGTFCLDSNNCGFLQAADQTSIEGNTGNIALGSGLTIVGNTLVNSQTQTTINNFDGSVVLQGTANQVIVSNSNGTITLKTPQSIATNSSPTFAGLTVTGADVTLNGLDYSLPDAHVADGVLINDGTGSLTWDTVANACPSCYLQEGNSFGETAILGTNDNNNLEFETNDTTRVTIDTDGNVGIGTETPNHPLHVVGLGIRQERFAGIAQFLGDRAQGTQDAPTAIGNNTILAITGRGYDGTNYINAAQIAIASDGGGVGTNDMPGRITFATTADGAATQTERMRLTSTGLLEIGSTTTGGTVEKFRVNTPTTVDNLAASTFATGATTSKAIVVQGAAAQTANLQEWQDSSGGVLASIGSDGDITGASQLAVGSDAVFNPGTIAYFAETSTDTTGFASGITTALTADPTGASDITYVGHYNAVGSLSGNAQDFGRAMYGSLNIVGHEGSGVLDDAIGIGATIGNGGGGDIGSAVGVYSAVGNTSSGNITQAAVALLGQIENSGSGTITSATGLLIQSTSNTFGGSITENYGGHIEVQTAGDSDYGLRVDTADTQTLWIGGTAAGDGGTANTGIAFGSTRDTNLYRSAASTLKTDDNLIVSQHGSVGDTGGLDVCTITTCPAAEFGLHVGETLTAVDTFAAGLVSEVDVNPTANTGGLHAASLNYMRTNNSNTRNITLGTFGSYNIADILGSGTVTLTAGTYSKASGDASAVVTSANGLYVDSANFAGGSTVTSNYGIQVKAQTSGASDYGIAVEAADTQTLWVSSNANNTSAAAGIGFGLDKDTNLYRSTTDTLKTDSSMHVTDNLAVGTTPTTYQFEVAENAAAYAASFDNDGNNANRNGIRIQAGADDGSGTTTYIDFLDGDGTEVGFCQNNAGTFACSDSSDARTKTNINDTGVDASQILGDLRVVDFNRIQNPDGPLITGFIAQEVQEVYGQAVTMGSNGYLGVARDQFVPLLVKGHQNQQSELGGLDNRLTQLEQQVSALNGNHGTPTAPSNSFASINVSGPAAVGSLSVSGSATITGNLAVEGNATFEGNLAVQGHIIGNEDTRGTVTVAAGQTEVEHVFDTAYGETPNVILTPTNTFAPSYRVDADKDKFTVYLQTPPTQTTKLNYQVQE